MVKPAFRMTGDRALVATLAEMGSSAGGAVLDSSMRKGMNVVKGAAVAKAKKLRQRKTPNGKHMDQLMIVQKEKGRPRHNPKFLLGGVGRAKKIMHLVEFGTAPHWQPKRGIMHPGARPKPFMRPAFHERREQAMRVILESMKAGEMRRAAQIAAKNRTKR